MLMRVVSFDASGILEAFDFRSVLIHKQAIQANQKVKLPFTEKNFFKFNNAVFGVCEGVGDLDYRDYPKNLNFNVLLVESVSGVLSLYHGYFFGNINYFNEAVVTIISKMRALKGL